jgi:hypothetical protein
MAQRLLTQWLAGLNQPRGQNWPVFHIALGLSLRLLGQGKGNRHSKEQKHNFDQYCVQEKYFHRIRSNVREKPPRASFILPVWVLLRFWPLFCNQLRVLDSCAGSRIFSLLYNL